MTLQQIHGIIITIGFIPVETVMEEKEKVVLAGFGLMTMESLVRMVELGRALGCY